MIVGLANRDENLNSSDIRDCLERKGIEVSQSTIRRRLLESGGKWTSPTPKPLLLERHRNNRLLWALNVKNVDWNRVIFTDESTFKLNQNTKKVWQFPGKRKIFRTVKHPLKVHVWG
jgi:hypothetical protein